MLDALQCGDPPLVRLAGPADEEGVVEMIRIMHDDGEWCALDAEGCSFPFSPTKARAIVQRATQGGRNAPDAGRAWLGVIGETGQLKGSAYVALQEPSMSEGFYLAELWSWICPELRNTAASDSLIEFAMAIADMKHMRLVMAAMTQKRMGKARFYDRRFGAPIGSVYNYYPNGA
jgi:hypothetical protein